MAAAECLLLAEGARPPMPTMPEEGWVESRQPLIWRSMTPQVAILQLGRTVTMGNTLEAPREGDWGFVIQPEHFDLIRNAGFRAVRIPIRWSAHAGQAEPFAIEPAFISRIDEVAGWGIERGLAVILNSHHYEEMAVDPRGQELRLQALWRQIAAGLILGGGHWNSCEQLPLLTLPNAPGLIASFHYYNPFQFTHQGAEWMAGSDAWLGTTWTATEAERAQVVADCDGVALWSRQTQVSVSASTTVRRVAGGRICLGPCWWIEVSSRC